MIVPNQDKLRYPGSASFAPNVGFTPFGYFDTDPDFQKDIVGATQWAASCLGYPIIDIEMIDTNFFSRFEEAVLEYSAQVNQFNIRNNMYLLQGQSTKIDATQKNVQGSGVTYQASLASDYGTLLGVGGNVDWKRGHILTETGSNGRFKQYYDLQALWGDTIESGSRIKIKRVFHNMPPAFARIYDPFSMTGMSYSNILNEMGFAGYSPATQFLMTPIFEDLLRGQAIEFNDMVRKSAYSFELVNNKLKLFPAPNREFKVHFEYIIEQDSIDNIFFPADSQNSTSSSAIYYPSGSKGSAIVGDYSNAPYSNIPYMDINSVGRQWIRKYFLALCKELLGGIRQKYQTIPVPGGEVSLDGAELRQEASSEKTELIAQLRENLETTGRSAQMEKQAQQAEQLQQTLRMAPLSIYIG
jgi:hypothetical protein